MIKLIAFVFAAPYIKGLLYFTRDLFYNINNYRLIFKGGFYLYDIDKIQVNYLQYFYSCNIDLAILVSYSL